MLILFYLQISGRLRPGTYGRYYRLPAGEENTRAMLTNVKFLWILKLCSMHLLKILSKAAIMRNTNLVMRKRLGYDVSTGGNGTTE